LTQDEGDTLIQPTTEGTRPGRVRRPYPKRESEKARRRRPGGTVALSIVLHVVIGAALLRVLMMPYPFLSLFSEKEERIEPERISFLALPQTAAEPTPGRSGGNNRPETTRRTPPAPPIAAPTEVPSVVPPVSPAAPPTPAPSTDEGTGPLVGRGGATRGIRPSYSDPRIWVPDAPVVSAPKSADARMDSAVTAAVEAARDSAAAVAYTPNKFERGDWTVEDKNGRKYGMDTEFIRLGKVSIPLPLLALLPMNLAQGNPTAAAREREMASMRSEIMFHAQRSMNEQEFRKAVKSLRERKERERQQQEKPRGKPIAGEASRPVTPTP